jgi:hypothetical protein
MHSDCKSQIGQDKWVLEVLKEKRDGIFVDIGGGHPVQINNTYILEKQYDWTGISVDIGPPHTHGCTDMSMDEYTRFWDSQRSTPIICNDALNIDYSHLFKEHNLPRNINYLSLDLEPPMRTYECLLKIPLDEYIFDAITFETDYYREQRTQEPSRQLLRQAGYILITSVSNQEDWYVHNSLQPT